MAGTMSKRTIMRDLRVIARNYTHEALGTIVETMRKTQDEKLAVVCAEILLDRGWGKPTTYVAAEIPPEPTSPDVVKAEFLDRLVIAARDNGLVSPSQLN